MGYTLRQQEATDLLTRLGFSVIQRTAIMHAPRVLMVPLARLLDRMVADRDVKERYLGAIERFEAAERWPTRFVTGHFIALLAKKT